MGDLSQFIKRRRSHKSSKSPSGGLSERLVRHFLKQLGTIIANNSQAAANFALADALKFLRSRNLVHRDIKPQVTKSKATFCHD